MMQAWLGEHWLLVAAIASVDFPKSGSFSCTPRGGGHALSLRPVLTSSRGTALERGLFCGILLP